MGIPERLSFARSTLKLTLQDVESRTNVGASSLSEFENGKREPKVAQLKELADCYKRPLSFFLEEGNPASEHVLWRMRPTSPKAEDIQAELLKLARQYYDLEVWCDRGEPCELPPLPADSVGQLFGYGHAERLARYVSRTLGLGDRPGETLLRILEEECRVKVFHLPFEPSGTAACTVHPVYGAAILLNSKNGLRRRSFDLAHELFHLLTWTLFRKDGDAVDLEASEQEEKFANCFARNLLIPPEALKAAIDPLLSPQGSGKLDFDHLFEVARSFGVSVDAIIVQIGFVYRQPQDWGAKARESMRGLINRWDDRPADAVPARPVRYKALADEALRKGTISVGRYAEYMGVSRREAMMLVEQDVGEDAEIEVAHP